MRWPAERSQEAFDGLLVLARIAALARSQEKVPGVVVDLMQALAEDAVSTHGSGSGSGGTLMDMSKGLPADQAGAEVGLSGRRVRQLCCDGLVRHVMFDGRYVVDVEDLRAHLRGRAS